MKTIQQGSVVQVRDNEGRLVSSWTTEEAANAYIAGYRGGLQRGADVMRYVVSEAQSRVDLLAFESAPVGVTK